MEEDIMQTYEVILGIVLMVLSVALTVIVLFQPGKDKSLSGSITGGADTFVGKGRTNSKEKILSKITVVMFIIFVLIIAALYCIL